MLSSLIVTGNNATAACSVFVTQKTNENGSSLSSVSRRDIAVCMQPLCSPSTHQQIRHGPQHATRLAYTESTPRQPLSPMPCNLLLATGSVPFFSFILQMLRRDVFCGRSLLGSDSLDNHEGSEKGRRSFLLLTPPGNAVTDTP